MNCGKRGAMKRTLGCCFFGILSVVILWTGGPLFAEVQLYGPDGKILKSKSDAFSISASAYERSDVIMMNNLIDLDSKGKKDSMSYLGMEYYLETSAKYRESAEVYARFQRTGPSYEDAIVLGRRSVSSIYGETDRIHGKQYLPEVKELFLDLKVPGSAYELRSKVGLFSHILGGGYAGAGYFENYGAALYHPGEKFAWTFYWNRPDWNNRMILGPILEQDKKLGRGYQATVADYFSLDGIYQWNQEQEESWRRVSGSLQPYVSMLSDRTGGKRASLFAVQTEQDLLGTLGFDLKLKWNRIAFDFETARNFGGANAKGGAIDSDGLLDSRDISHKGYMLASEVKVDLREVWLTPRASFMLASGNELDGSDVNGVLQGSANRAFSNYSPLNTNLWDTIYQPRENGPLAAMGTGWGSYSGILRPGTFGDPYILENLAVPNLGFDFNPFKKLTMSVDWWYLASRERGVGTWQGETFQLPRELGHEWDLSATYEISDHWELGMAFGYFIPGQYYRVQRDDGGSSFSPLVRGDDDADNAFYGEITLTLKI